VRLYGPKRPTLNRTAQEVREALANIKGITDLHVEGQAEEAQVEIKVDIVAAERHGLKPGDIRRQVATIFAGLQVGTLFEQQKVFEVVVWGVRKRAATSPTSMSSCSRIQGHSRAPGDVPSCASAHATVINHEALSPRIDVVANVRGRDWVRRRRRRSSSEEVKFPLEYEPSCS